ncbi:alpha/beta hydrolase [Rhodococcus sp. BP-349]|uniref:alpha/beta fold hydrolase n=1 Tax=unclassified Rhodococcus (in: high G+C Gram-positive bacteria) TaxID=192944 RepID=UPI001C9A5A8A|nr:MULTISPECIES: alpha/beta hydrolase [unclassified Rhodococcus (in: high G+C Gram-positive bacteria)]MBY6540700.1 alpha/beta hydrolase [Rhodococcus sp. BP-363]MBY6545275.1 alpha/beta hydrolase [Rhodococcus sp. BP-369]MBY6564505.1 alpha/beta hydrolase [Rhodococcus sp. BP-370]MBY6578559.1 alpha/beta hydrolase [Rhodococcus sp. BP-364]MBY6587860.1 alpha/beta hydrolase [Rhodococcus sp. BP-358]
MFEKFDESMIDVEDASILTRHCGAGDDPVVLLHGHPRTSATWHRVAPLLVDAGHTVVCPDLRGYGRSQGPPPTPDHSAHSKRAMARDMVQVMAALGHRRFAVVGHDRGSYVALRLSLDHPSLVTALSLLDCIPISEHLDRADSRFATRWWHWFFYARPDLPERAISADPAAWYRGDPALMGAENHREWLAAIHDPDVVRAMLEDYRAGITVDADHERADRSQGTSLTMPVQVLWSTRDDLEELYGDPLTIWRSWAPGVVGHGIDSGHHMAEEAPRALAGALLPFLASAGRSNPVQ